jgi:hypothetical protein
MTVTERIDSLAEAPGVLAAFRAVGAAGQARPVGGNLHAVLVHWYTVEGDITTEGKGNLIVINAESEDPEAPEVAYWLGQLPGPLRPAAPEIKYLTDRTTGNWGNLSSAAQQAAILEFCNAVYKEAVSGARDIREFRVEAIDGKTVKVSGYFNVGENLAQWQYMTWYIKLIDANGSVASPYSNIEFQAVVA